MCTQNVSNEETASIKPITTMHDILLTDCPIIVNALNDCFPAIMKALGNTNRKFVLELAQILTFFK